MPLFLMRGHSDGSLDLLIILDDASYARIKERDPCVFDLRQLPREVYTERVHMIGCVWASEEDQAEIVRLVRANDQAGAMKYATRGFKVKPGDHDHPPVSIASSRGDA